MIRPAPTAQQHEFLGHIKTLRSHGWTMDRISRTVGMSRGVLTNWLHDGKSVGTTSVDRYMPKLAQHAGVVERMAKARQAKANGYRKQGLQKLLPASYPAVVPMHNPASIVHHLTGVLEPARAAQLAGYALRLWSEQLEASTK